MVSVCCGGIEADAGADEAAGAVRAQVHGVNTAGECLPLTAGHGEFEVIVAAGTVSVS
jgi:hypothetical protein